MEELEAKLEVHEDFAMPDLASILAGIEADPPETVELDALYWDTPDVALLRAGATLRHREGRWQVKVDAGGSTGLLQRHEIDLPGSADTPPREAVRVVRTLLGSGQLAPVARLATRRRVVRLRRAGGVVVEIVDDHVRAALEPTERAEAAFRELEVEAGPAGDERDVRVCAAALREAGAEPAAARPKLARVLAVRGHLDVGQDGGPSTAVAAGADGYDLVPAWAVDGRPRGSASTPPAGAARLRAALHRSVATLAAADVDAAATGDHARLAAEVAHTRGLVDAARSALPAATVDAALPHLSELDDALGDAVDARAAADLQRQVGAGLPIASLRQALDAAAVAAEARAKAAVESAALLTVVDVLRDAAATAAEPSDAEVHRILRAARVRSRSLRRRSASDPARAAAAWSLHGALDLARGPSTTALRDVEGLLAVLTAARSASRVRHAAEEMAESADDPRVAFACRAVAARADRRLRTAGRRARRRWVTLDATALSGLADTPRLPHRAASSG